MAKREGYERLLRLAAYVGSRRVHGCTISEIAVDVPGYGDLGRPALEKALHRDSRTLADGLGIVLEWSHDKQRYFIKPPYFTSEERRSLIAAAGAVDVDGIGQDQGPGELGAAVEQDVAHVVVQVHGQVVEIRDAIAARQAISFEYQGATGAPETRFVDPYALGLWRNRWYFNGFDHTRDARRVYRLDRISIGVDGPAISAVGTRNSYEIPPDVDPIAALHMDPNTWGLDEPMTARVHVARDQVPMFLGEFAGRSAQHEIDGSIVEVEVRDYESFVIRLLGFGTGVRLLEPAPLVTLLRDWLTAEVQH